MNLRFNQSLADGYKSPSQRIRRMSEGWFVESAFCPACGNRFRALPTNNPVSDVACKGCKEEFQLKASSKRIGRRILDGEYETFKRYLERGQSPGFMVMTYNAPALRITDLIAIPGHFVTASMLDRRNALSPSADRKGYVGCYIRIGDIPASGRIHLVQSEIPVTKRNVMDLWKRNAFLKDISIESRGWIVDVWRCIDKIQKKEFTLDEAYHFEAELKQRHPNNRHVREKIRQVLQQLRDIDKLEFVSRGNYRLLGK